MRKQIETARLGLGAGGALGIESKLAGWLAHADRGRARRAAQRPELDDDTIALAVQFPRPGLQRGMHVSLCPLSCDHVELNKEVDERVPRSCAVPRTSRRALSRYRLPF